MSVSMEKSSVNKGQEGWSKDGARRMDDRRIPGVTPWLNGPGIPRKAKAPKLGETLMFSTEEHTPIDNDSTADALTWVGIFRCPAALSTAQFYDKSKENEGIFTALPISQKNVLKLTLLFQNDAMANDLQPLGVTTTGSTVIGMIRIATHQGVKQIADELVKAGLSANATCFSVDIVTKLDKH
ncbi:hypothetical protein C8R47DRAFT_1076932 [Mycena vitilis]|nr:hypothetical protein C8R47DRAFT_1076932 [Mycena vitilis]